MAAVDYFNGLGWFVIEVALKSAGLLCLVLLLDRFWLHRRPLAADMAWFVTLLALLALPICIGVSPRLTIPLPVASKPAESTKDQVTASSRVLVGDSKQVVAPPEVAKTMPPVREHEPEPALAVPPQENAEGPAPATGWPSPSPLTVIATVYCFGLTLCGLRLATSLLALRRLRGEARPVVNDVWNAVLIEQRNKLGMRRSVELLHSDRISTPLAMGWLRPTIMLPTPVISEVDRSTAEVVLLHELTHHIRGDVLAHLLAKLIGCLHWFNPLVWRVLRRVEAVREQVCDGYCLQLLGDESRYVDVLIDFAGRVRRSPPVPLGVAMVRIPRLAQRLEHLMAVQRPAFSGLTRRAWATASLLSAILWGATSAGQLESPPTTPSVADLVQALRESEAAIESLAAKFNVESHNNFAEPGQPLPDGVLLEDSAVSMQRQGSISWEINRDGRGRMKASYFKTNSRLDGSEVHKREEYLATYDGQQGQMLTTIKSPEGVVRSSHRRATRQLAKTGASPFDVAMHYLGEPISTALAQADCRVIGQRQLAGRSLVVIESAPKAVRQDYTLRTQFWIDPERGHLAVRRMTFVQRGEGKPWGLHLLTDLSDCREIVPGIWLPASYESWNHLVTDQGRGHLVSHERIKVSEWSVNQPIPPSRYAVDQSSLDKIGVAIAAPVPVADRPDAGRELDFPEAPDDFRYMRVKTVDDQGKPLANTHLYISIWPEGPHQRLKREYFTDAEGQVDVLVPDPPRLFRMWTKRPGYVPLFSQWWPGHQADGDQIPREFTLRLPAGSLIGGVVEDMEGKPIEGAIVEVMLANDVDEMGRRPAPSIWLAEVPGPGNNPCVTDQDGRWSLDNVPPGDDIHVRVKLTHPDYVSDTKWGQSQWEQNVTMESLRARTATLRMQQGVALRGTVSGPNGEVVPEAVVVWGDDPYMQEGSQEVRANADGTFQLAPLREGTVTLTVMAPGWSPAQQVLELGNATPPVNLPLEAGHLLQVRFVDQAGQPIPNAGVSIDRWRGAKSIYNHRHPNVLETGIPRNADNNGIYRWDWAPADAVSYRFYAKGHQSVRRSLVADGNEHEVVLPAE